MKQHWCKCTYEQWMKGGPELMNQFEEILSFVTTPLRRKIDLYANRDSPSALTSIIFSCTEVEMRNYARMLSEMLIDLHAWINGKDKYTQEAQGLEKGPDTANLPDRCGNGWWN
ncbi:hypothetical protein CALVIDRAFT_563047 [Calocera viscosa TUFC12733]|uniref:THO complex subunitTHOC2 C-terminal domain-containing protein n=1 Tax=Calocera viscosa (strain TUFC12733) TaxID=1330018 RepID=A0A167N1L7_CALVF|nr:hypothetical protein CALVIDRAFT_563047 [Calocera viscosa TUFC12733]